MLNFSIDLRAVFHPHQSLSYECINQPNPFLSMRMHFSFALSNCKCIGGVVRRTNFERLYLYFDRAHTYNIIERVPGDNPPKLPQKNIFKFKLYKFSNVRPAKRAIPYLKWLVNSDLLCHIITDYIISVKHKITDRVLHGQHLT